MTEEEQKIEEEIQKTKESLKSLKSSSSNNNVSSSNMTIISVVVAFLLIGGALFFTRDGSMGDKSDSRSQGAGILSTNGIHYHTNIKITVKGESIVIPANTGISGGVHQPMHTHDTTGTVHTEIGGQVFAKDVKLERFFGFWGQTFNKKCILDNCNGSDGKVRMLVNGVENKEFEKYSVRDRDQIEIIFE